MCVRVCVCVVLVVFDELVCACVGCMYICVGSW